MSVSKLIKLKQLIERRISQFGTHGLIAIDNGTVLYCIYCDVRLNLDTTTIKRHILITMYLNVYPIY